MSQDPLSPQTVTLQQRYQDVNSKEKEQGDLGRIGGGMPGTLAPLGLAKVFGKVAKIMQGREWAFIDYGADYGRMMVAAMLAGASAAKGVELNEMCVFNHDAYKAKLLAAFPDLREQLKRTRMFHGNAMSSSFAPHMLFAPGEASNIVVGLADEGMEMGVREAIYFRAGLDERVKVLFTASYSSRRGNLPALLRAFNFKEYGKPFDAALRHAKTHVTVSIYVRSEGLRLPAVRRSARPTQAGRPTGTVELNANAAAAAAEVAGKLHARGRISKPSPSLAGRRRPAGVRRS